MTTQDDMLCSLAFILCCVGGLVLMAARISAMSTAKHDENDGGDERDGDEGEDDDDVEEGTNLAEDIVATVAVNNPPFKTLREVLIKFDGSQPHFVAYTVAKPVGGGIEVTCGAICVCPNCRRKSDIVVAVGKMIESVHEQAAPKRPLVVLRPNAVPGDPRAN